MLAFQDFYPQQTDPGGFLKPEKWESLRKTVREVNEWITQNNIRVLNMETLVLPNIWNDTENGPSDPKLRTSGELPTYWYQVLRVWYQKD
jgi:hypothetical protein